VCSQLREVVMFKIPREEICGLLEQSSNLGNWQAILESASIANPIDLAAAANLLQSAKFDSNIQSALCWKADQVRTAKYGPDVKLFIPVYLSNICENDCVYCAYRSGNKSMPRRTLDEADFRREMDEVLGMGYRVIELVTSESTEIKKDMKLGKFVSIAREMAGAASESPDGYEVILMSWALSDDEFRDVSEAGCDGFYLWQETYDRDTYERLHPTGTPKSDFDFRLGVFDRAIKSGIKKIGMGVLFGLSGWEFDVLTLIAHGKYLENEYGIKIDAIGIPRFKPALGAQLENAPSPVTDAELKIAVALFRLAFPDTNIFLNTREKLNLLFDLLKCGGSEMNLACAVFPGGYTERTPDRQFDYYSYPTEKTLGLLIDKGYKPTYFVQK
jgi:2-iminoacetate synthase